MSLNNICEQCYNLPSNCSAEIKNLLKIFSGFFKGNSEFFAMKAATKISLFLIKYNFGLRNFNTEQNKAKHELTFRL